MICRSTIPTTSNYQYARYTTLGSKNEPCFNVITGAGQFFHAITGANPGGKEKRKKRAKTSKKGKKEASCQNFNMVRNYASRRARAAKLTQNIRRFFPGDDSNDHNNNNREEEDDNNSNTAMW